MEMHCLPMRHVMEVLRKHDFAVLEVIRDSWTGPQHSSYTFLATKREDSGKHGL
jgi:hypothetical protein